MKIQLKVSNFRSQSYASTVYKCIPECTDRQHARQLKQRYWQPQNERQKQILHARVHLQRLLLISQAAHLFSHKMRREAVCPGKYGTPEGCKFNANRIGCMALQIGDLANCLLHHAAVCFTSRINTVRSGVLSTSVWWN